MRTTTLNVTQTTVATKQFALEASCRVPTPWVPCHKAEPKPRMSWFVVTEDDGKQQLRMCWNLVKK